MTPQAGPFLDQVLSFEQMWKKSTRWCYIPNIKALGLVVSEKKSFNFFILKIYFNPCDLAKQWTGTIWTILKEGHIRIIPTKLGQNPASS